MMNHPMIDETDLAILQLLLKASNLSYKEIGQLVHMTGQAVGARVRKLEDLGVIEGYTLRWNPDRLGLVVHAFVTVFMNSGSAHQGFQDYIADKDCVTEVHRVSGEGCYWMSVRVDTPARLNEFLEGLLQFANYRVSLSIGRVK